MKRLVQWTILVVAAAGWAGAPATADAAGFQTYAQSATSTGMGNVGIANPHEPNASFYNPALMSQHDGFNIYGGPTVVVPNSTFQPTGDGSEVATESNVFPPPNGHIGYGVTDNLSIGVGATFPYGLGVSWPDNWVGREDIQFQQLQTLNVTPSAAYTIPDTNFTVAAGGQIALSSVELERAVVLREDTEVQTRLGGNGIGFGALAGLLYQPTDSLTFGLNYRSAINIDYEGRVHFEGEEGTPFEQQFVDGDVSTALTLPHMIGVGAGWQIERLFLELDLIYTTWSTYDEVAIDFENDRPQDQSVIRNNWNDSATVRLGAQYEVVDRLPVRLGFAFDSTPIPDDFVSASLPGNHRLIASFGGGYTMKNGLRFDLAYQLVSALPRDVEGSPNAPDGEYQTTAHLFGVNVGYGYNDEN